MVNLIAKKILRIYVHYFPIKINYGWFFMHPDNVELLASMLTGRYEIASTALFRNIIKPGWTVIDVGAYIGYYSRLFSDLAGNKGKVIAFEPDPFNRKLLSKNLKHCKNVQIRSIACGNKKGKGKLYINTSDSSLILSSVSKNCVNVKVNKLDNLIGKQPVNLIKIDVQGYDLNVLRGAKKVLENNPKIILHLEFWPKGLREAKVHPQNILTFLQKTGFKTYIVGGGKIDYSDKAVRLLNIAEKEPGGFIDLLCFR